MRLHIKITGIVQGVGFRPFVYRIATQRQLAGWVRNATDGVYIEAQGHEQHIRDFLSALTSEKPSRAHIETIAVTEIAETGESHFVIRESTATAGEIPRISPDIATCPDCLAEIKDPGDRRHRYAFTNCTNCGPRYTIIKSPPYDRSSTTMSDFIMCPDCRHEFEDPANRRFHAQPNACPRCGPEYRLTDNSGKLLIFPGNTDIFMETRRLIKAGAIIAIKGLGGFHLACDAYNEEAVSRLRSRKIREDKPFAVMGGSLGIIRHCCQLSPVEVEMLTGPIRPIVLLDKSADYNLAGNIAPGNPRIGVMLPYTPAHELLLGADDIWVMTSGNTSDEPIAYQDADALARLAGIADYFFIHNRDIYRRADDSVVRIFDNAPYIFRRSRGYTPLPLKLQKPTIPLLACGGELKSAFCLASGDQAFLSSHIGDLDNIPTYQYYIESIEHYKRLFQIKPQAIAHDLHPGYISTKYAQAMDLPRLAIQHHHAHIAAVLAEHGVDEPVIGVSFDGTGYGTDGALWGGEFLIADCREFTRAAHLRYIPLPGGAKAIKEPWRLAVWILHEVFGCEFTGAHIPFLNTLPSDWPIIVKAAAAQFNSPLTSSAGRLFDAAAALTGVRQSVNYEGQAAVELELAAGTFMGERLPYVITDGTPKILNLLPAFEALARKLRAGDDPRYLAAAFHTTVAAAAADMVSRISAETGIKKIALSGGVFQNVRLLTELTQLFRDQQYSVYLHRQVPPNDGGLSLGQAVIAGEHFRQYLS